MRTWWAIVDITEDLPQAPIGVYKHRWWARYIKWWLENDKDRDDELLVIPWQVNK